MTSFNLAASVEAKTFRLAVVRPVTGKAGELMFTRTVDADSISEAVKLVRKEVDGTGFLVMQESAYGQSVQPMNTMTAALLKAYNASLSA